MSETYTLLAPLPQLTMNPSFPAINLKPGLSIDRMTPKLRRRLLNIAKDHRCSEDMIAVLVESELVFWAEVPHSSMPPRLFLYYSVIAQEILKRIFDCLLLFDWIPGPLLHYCWFIGVDSGKAINLQSLKPINANWENIDNFINIDWRFGRSGCGEPVNISLSIVGLEKYWDKLSVLCPVERLSAPFTNVKKLEAYLKKGSRHSIQKAEELIKAKYGREARIETDGIVTMGPDSDTIAEEATKCANEPKMGNLPKLISERTMTKWFFEGFNNAYFDEAFKLRQELYRRPSGQRFIRAFQFFSNAFRIPNPHRFVAFMTCLEAIFCKETGGITSQLRTRIASFLSPDNPSETAKISKDVEKLYDLRSKIVHGAKYSVKKIEQSERDIVSLIRRVFLKILSVNSIYSLAFDKDQNLWDKYLGGLSLGQAN